MRINHNIAALNTYRQLTAGQSAATKNMEKLSSGLRINKAGDDAAGLAISEKMRGQIRGLEQAGRNAQDSISMIQTAEGALNEVHSILQRMRELAVQAGNDTNTSTDRNEIQKEINQLTSEINRIANTTEFNTQKLLNATAGNVTNGTSAVSATSFSSTQTASGTQVKYQGTYTGTTDIALKIKWSQTDSKYQYSTDGSTFKDITWDTSNNFTFQGITFTKPSSNPTSDQTDTINLTAAKAAVAAKSSFITQIGANENQTMTLEFSDMRAAALGITGTGSGFTASATVTDGTNNNAIEKALNVSTAADAGNAVTRIQAAIDIVSAERSKLGAYQNRLEHTINNLGTAAENLTASESRIRDVDYALAA
ncbi:flagellin [Anoxybacillus flavithermus]|uniref:flagellin N-terminal helical domain-containing protein n=1 Tax=Anoxybacillus flavithermus TaxID=33934 RepID=UPI00186822F8|nr:flagellin [Anoxybacillus flavithermus]MBE2922750.1 flagellin [Anoxybacillus flavithermus]MBE2933534.1 flagellin [Anoxybacillus flavithermus]